MAVTCTSGTAAANLAPAVIEAHQARVPLIVLTADRPAELRDVGAGQTIDQLKLYGDAVKWFFEVGCRRRPRRRCAGSARSPAAPTGPRSRGGPGPVHLNFPLREPLVLDAPLAAESGARPPRRPAVGQPPVSRHRLAAGDGRLAAGTGRPLPARGVVVAGRDERDDRLVHGRRRVRRGAPAIPLLADPLSGARRGDGGDRPLRPAAARPGVRRAVCRPTLVVRVGDLPTSKPLRAWLAAAAETEQVALDPDGAWQDPAAVVDRDARPAIR